MFDNDDILNDILSEEETMRYFTIDYEDGTSAEVGILAQFRIDFEDLGTSQEYIVVTELVDGEFPEGEMEVMPFRYYPDPLNPENFRLGDVESEEEREIVQSTFEDIMSGEPDASEDNLYS